MEALRSQPRQYDIIITDMTMPKMNGDKLAAEARSICPDIPIILCTGFSKKISPAKALEIGINSMLMKPLTLTVLANTVKKVMAEAKGPAQT